MYVMAYYKYNLQGDVVGLYNTSGQEFVTYTYDPWGKPLSATGISPLLIANPFRYRGYVYDDDTGLYYCNSRYYDPETGRWINADGQLNTDAVLGYNMYAYCYNNPVILNDTTGNRPIISMDVKSETEAELDASVAYMRALPYYNQIAQTQSALQKMGFVDTSYKTAKDCTDTLIKNGIDTAEEKAHFFSQCAHESKLGEWLTEWGSLEYLSSKSYYPYYGAGYIQLTHKCNYQSFADAMGDQQIVIQGPSYVAANYAWSAAGWFWTEKRMNDRIAAGANVSEVTQIVNGGYNGLSERQRYYSTFLPIFGG